MLYILLVVALGTVIINGVIIYTLIKQDQERIADLQEINIMLERLQCGFERDLKKWEEIHQIAKGGK